MGQAATPALLDLGTKGRLLVYSFATGSSGVPTEWAAKANAPGVDLLSDLSDATADRIIDQIARTAAAHDIIVASIHWGGNWGYEIPFDQRRFAHRLIDGGVSVVYGHSSHHPKAIEIHRQRLILYGCGDFLNDYEGISGKEEYRGDLCLMYLPELDAQNGRLVSLQMVPLQMRRFRLQRASGTDSSWLARTLDRESRKFGTSIVSGADGALRSVDSRPSGQR